MPKKQPTNAKRARDAARQGAKYTEALRTGAAADTTDETPGMTVTVVSITPPQPDDGFGGHEFEYDSTTDLFRCTECRVYEIVARDGDGPIAPCTGLVGYGGDTERVYLLLTTNPVLHDGYLTSLATRVRSTGIGRAPRFWWRDGQVLIESAPSVVADLARQIEQIAFTVNGQQVPAVAAVEHLTAEAGRAIIAENQAAYVAKYGEPA